MIKLLLNRSIEVLRNEGIRGYIHFLKTHFLFHPIGDDLWYILNYYLRPSHKTIKKVQGSKMLLQLSDRGIHKDLFLYGCREPQCTEIFKKELSEGMKVLEIGANIGYYVLMAAQIVGNTGKVYALEPDPQNFEILRRNVELNSYSDRVELYNLAAGDNSGEALLDISGDSNTHKIILSKSHRNKKQNYINVKMVTIDEFLKDRHVDFIRMDVEGFEYGIIKGMTRLLSKEDSLQMFIEVHPWLIKEYGGSYEEMLELLSISNFNVNYLLLGKKPRFLLSRRAVGEAPYPETVIEYRQPLRTLVTDEEIGEVPLNLTQGYHIFLEKSAT